MNSVRRRTEIAVRLILGGVFLVAGLLKFEDPPAFADSIYAFSLIPRILINPLAAGLPLLEIVLGAMLVGGFAQRMSAALAFFLCAVFVVALSQAWVRGLILDCGCFGSGKQSAWNVSFSILRDVGLLLAAAFVYRAACRPEPESAGENP